MKLHLIIFRIALWLFASSYVVANPSITPERIVFEAGSIAAPGYVVKEESGSDTSAVMGYLKHKTTSFRIDYSIFTYEFILADPEQLRSIDKVVWSRRSGHGDAQAIATLVKELDGTRIFYISFPRRGPANFLAKVSSDSPLSERQINEVTQIATTFRPRTEKERVTPR